MALRPWPYWVGDMSKCEQDGQPMNENNNEQYATRTLHIGDLVGGEGLLIAYFPGSGVVTANGSSVTRSPELEDRASLAVFLRPLDNKLFTIETSVLGRLFL